MRSKASVIALERLQFANGYSRLEALLVLYRHLPQRAFWRLFGEEWSRCESITRQRHVLRTLFLRRFQSGGAPIFEAMSVKDHRAYDALPDRITIFRGCYAHNRLGFSWSLSAPSAVRYPFLRQYRRPGQPVLLTASVHKDKIAFVTVATGVADVVVLPQHRRIVGTQPIEDQGGAESNVA